MAINKWGMQIIDGEYNGTNYQHAPFVRIFEKGIHDNEYHVATVNLIGAAYVSAPRAGDKSINEEKIAKARLIAAAPDLLELLEENVSWAEYAQQGKEPTQWLVKARALLSNIKGE